MDIDIHPKPYLNVVLLGATGATGEALLLQLIQSQYIASVRCIGRRLPRYEHPKVEAITAPLDQAVEYAHALWGASVLFCCLGTTMKQAGSRSAFRAVDYSMVVDAAIMAKETGIGHFSMVSAAGSNASSPFFYSRVKAEAESAATKSGPERISIFRPGLLDAARENHRIMEATALSLLRPIAKFRPLAKLLPTAARPLAVSDLARVMLHEALHPATGLQIYEPQDITDCIGRMN